MMTSNARTPDEYIAALPDDRRGALSAVRDVVRVRFRRLEDLPLDVSGDTIARVDLESFVAWYEKAAGSARKTRSATGAANP
jgi:hypothetical protein